MVKVGARDRTKTTSVSHPRAEATRKNLSGFRNNRTKSKEASAATKYPDTEPLQRTLRTGPIFRDPSITDALQNEQANERKGPSIRPGTEETLTNNGGARHCPSNKTSLTESPRALRTTIREGQKDVLGSKQERAKGSQR